MKHDLKPLTPEQRVEIEGLLGSPYGNYPINDIIKRLLDDGDYWRAAIVKAEPVVWCIYCKARSRTSTAPINHAATCDWYKAGWLLAKRKR